MNAIVKADEFIIDRVFQPAANYINVRTGISNFELGRYIYVGWFVYGLIVLQRAEFTLTRVIIVIGILAIPHALYLSIRIEKRMHASMYVNQYREMNRFLRIVFIFLIFINVAGGHMLNMAGCMSVVCTEYLFACSFPPPSYREAYEKKQLEKMQAVKV